MTMCGILLSCLGCIVGTPPLPLFVKGRVQDFSKIESLGEGVPKFLLKRGEYPKTGGLGGQVAIFLLLYTSITFTACVWEK